MEWKKQDSGTLCPNWWQVQMPVLTLIIAVSANGTEARELTAQLARFPLQWQSLKFRHFNTSLSPHIKTTLKHDQLTLYLECGMPHYLVPAHNLSWIYLQLETSVLLVQEPEVEIMHWPTCFSTLMCLWNTGFLFERHTLIRLVLRSTFLTSSQVMPPLLVHGPRFKERCFLELQLIGFTNRDKKRARRVNGTFSSKSWWWWWQCCDDDDHYSLSTKSQILSKSALCSL